MKYSVLNDVHIAEVPVKDFKVVMVNEKKKSSPKNSCNAGFFANYNEGKEAFTLPVGNLVCDYKATSSWVRHYCEERGKFTGANKFEFDCSTWKYQNDLYGKKVSTLLIQNGTAKIEEIFGMPSGLDYAISGVPIMKDGADVKFATTVKGQGWDASSLYATWHIFIGLKEENAKTVYVMALKTKTPNMITSAEAYKKFKALGFRDVIKLDGGGSFYFNASGVTKSTLENRRVNTIITFGATETVIKNPNPPKKKNPYPTPTVVLKYGNSYKEFNKWLQWELSEHGFQCTIDGGFGPTTLKQLKAFQAANHLIVDGVCGPATRNVLLK